MTKRQKEAIRARLEQEEKALEDLKRMYAKAQRDIENKIRMLQSDELTQSRIYQIQYQKALKGQVDGILDKLRGDEYATIQKYLSDSYTDAFVGEMYALHGEGVPVIVPIDQRAAVKAVTTESELSTDLYASLGYDMDKLKRHAREEITRGIATNLPFEQIARNLAAYTSVPIANAQRIVRTEGHRIQQASAQDARIAAKAKGADLVKQWDASLDGATRPLHRQLDGKVVEIEKPFIARGYRAMYPGKFGKPEQDCNCRCVALTRARSAMDEKELETLKERAKFFGLDKSRNFRDFRKKYLGAAQALKKQGKGGIIKKRKSAVSVAIKSGEVSTAVKTAAQSRHIKSSSGYIDGRSYLLGSVEDAQRLIDRLAGTGEPVMKPDGEWNRRERVIADEIIGVSVDPQTGEETETKRAMIHYSKRGSHIVPRK